MRESELVALLREDDEIITSRLRHWARTAGDRIFLYYGVDKVSLSYADFDRRTSSIAGNLVRHGVTKGDRISVYTRNPLVSALLMFGIWKAGAVYCPINFSYTGRLLAYQVDDTAPAIVCTDPALLPELNAVAARLAASPSVAVYEPGPAAHDYVPGREPVAAPLTEIPWPEIVRTAADPQVQVEFDDPANLVYTSGTTGPAKGVVQPYRWMAQYTHGLRLGLCQDDVIYNDLPMYHVGGAIANVARAAWVGCEVAVWDRFSPGEFWSRIAERSVTTAILLDVMIPWLAKATPLATDRENTLNKVYMQPLPLAHHDFSRRFGVDFVEAGFGQTESGFPLLVLLEEAGPGEGTPEQYYRGLSHAEIRAQADRLGVAVLDGRTVTRKGLLGRPSSFIEVSIRNERDEECDPGEVGQLAFRSRLPSLLFTSYLGKPDATATALRNTWFHTGDAAVLGDDGLLYFVDRLGDRLRVRGENVSSFQVEDLLLGHEAIQLCAVFGIPGAEGDEDDLVACIVPSPEHPGLTEPEVRAYAEANLPKFMRPRLIRIVDELPRTPTNKVEKYKLRQRVLAELASAKD
jgi:crotonobetaine/carnitine-CoA ligase